MPFCLTSPSCVPCSTIVPLFIYTILSAFLTVLSLCAIMMTVLSLNTSLRLSISLRSVIVSSDDGLIEYEDLRIPIYRPGNQYALFLSLAQLKSAATDAGIVVCRKGGNEIIDACRVCRGAEPLLVNGGVERDVFGNSAAEYASVLQNGSADIPPGIDVYGLQV